LGPSQIYGYSKLQEPIKTSENCYPLIWQILIIIIIILSIFIFTSTVNDKRIMTPVECMSTTSTQLSSKSYDMIYEIFYISLQNSNILPVFFPLEQKKSCISWRPLKKSSARAKDYTKSQIRLSLTLYSREAQLHLRS